MNLKTIVKLGETITKEYNVMANDTADFLGNKGVEVLSTPAMIKYMEQTAAQIIFDKLPQKYRTVGTKIDIKHINPTPVDAKITVKATVKDIKGNKISYNVEAFNEKDKIGFGVYDQHVINLEEFLAKQ